MRRIRIGWVGKNSIDINKFYIRRRKGNLPELYGEGKKVIENFFSLFFFSFLFFLFFFFFFFAFPPLISIFSKVITMVQYLQYDITISTGNGSCFYLHPPTHTHIPTQIYITRIPVQGRGSENHGPKRKHFRCKNQSMKGSKIKSNIKIFTFLF